MNDFLERLKRRKIVQWTVAYLGGAWLVLQVVDVVGDAFQLSPAVARGAVVVLGFGILATLILAWYHGDRGRQRVSGPELFLIGAVCTVAALALAFVRGEPLPEDDRMESGAPPARSVAVLPFLDLSPAGDQAYFADGMAEELLNALAQIPELTVAGRTSSFSFKDSPLSVREIGQRLGVAHVVSGSVRRSADQLRIRAELVDVSDGYRRWSDQYDRELSDVFVVQEDIARSIANGLELELRDGGGQIELVGQTDDHLAQDHYLRGRFEWNQRTSESLERAVASFEAAIARDPEYARAYVGLGDALAVLGFYDYRPPAEAFPAAGRAAAQALRIEPRLAEAHATLGYVALYHEWRWERAETEFLRAIELSPGYATAHQWYANHLTAMGRFAEAEAEMRRASELDPLSMIAHAATGWVLYYAGEYRRAIAQLEKALVRDSTFEPAYLWMGQAYEELGALNAAKTSFREGLRLSGGSAIFRAAMAHAHALDGEPQEARALLTALEREGEDRYVPSYEIARVYAGLGDLDAATAWLERARRERAHSMAFLAVDPQLAPLHRDERYLALMDALGLTLASAVGS